MVASAYPTDEITVVDIFCGAGGTTTGVKAADPRVTVKKAINHWSVAIDTHAKNHPETEHLCTDVDEVRPEYIGHSTFLVASPACPDHSLAKGAKRKKLKQLKLAFDGNEEPELPPEAEERSRCLMNDPLRFAEKNHNLFVILENVPDVFHWSEYQTWCKEWDALGYAFKAIYLNSMFMGVPQSRDRWYFIAWRKGLPAPNLNFHPKAYCMKCEQFVLAVQSWKKQGDVPWGRYGAHGQYWYRCPQCTEIVSPFYPAAANVIDWRRPAQKIGERTQPLAEKTMERIRYGLKKFQGKPFTTQLNKTTLRAWNVLDGVFPTQTGDNSQYLVHPALPFVLNTSHTGTGYVTGLHRPLGTQTSRQELALAIPPGFTFELNHDKLRMGEMVDPMRTQTSYDTTALVSLPIILDHVGEYRPRSLVAPLSTQVGGGEHHSLITPPFFVELHGTSTVREATDPLGAILAGGTHHALVAPSDEQVAAWLMTYYNNGQLVPLADASPTLTTRDRCAVLTSEQVRTDEIDINECRFRMLDIPEIQAAMAFPHDYILTGDRRARVRQLGNAVTPPVVTWIFRQCLKALGVLHDA
jgi:DNA (cytosine-5)-methyltransferase 1